MHTSTPSWRLLDQKIPGFLETCSRDGLTLITNETSENSELIRIFVRDENSIYHQKIEYTHEESINSVACSANGSLIVIGSEKHLRIFSWDGSALHLVFQHAGAIHSVSCSADGELVTACAQISDKKNTFKHDKRYSGFSCGYVFSRQNGTWHHTWSYPLERHAENIEQLVCSGDGTRIAIGSLENREHTIRIFEHNNNDWNQVASILVPAVDTHCPFWSMRTNHDGSIIIAAWSRDSAADVFVHDGTSLTKTTLQLPDSTPASAGIACTDDGSIIIIGGASAEKIGFYVRTTMHDWQQQDIVTLPDLASGVSIACSHDASIVAIALYTAEYSDRAASIIEPGKQITYVYQKK